MTICFMIKGQFGDHRHEAGRQNQELFSQYLNGILVLVAWGHVLVGAEGAPPLSTSVAFLPPLLMWVAFWCVYALS